MIAINNANLHRGGFSVCILSLVTDYMCRIHDEEKKNETKNSLIKFVLTESKTCDTCIQP